MRVQPVRHFWLLVFPREFIVRVTIVNFYRRRNVFRGACILFAFSSIRLHEFAYQNSRVIFTVVAVRSRITVHAGEILVIAAASSQTPYGLNHQQAGQGHRSVSYETRLVYNLV